MGHNRYMTPKQFRQIIKSAGLSVRAAAMEMELSIRQAYRYTSGDAEIPRIIEYAVRWLAYRHTQESKK